MNEASTNIYRIAQDPKNEDYSHYSPNQVAHGIPSFSKQEIESS